MNLRLTICFLVLFLFCSTFVKGAEEREQIYTLCFPEDRAVGQIIIDNRVTKANPVKEARGKIKIKAKTVGLKVHDEESDLSFFKNCGDGQIIHKLILNGTRIDNDDLIYLKYLPNLKNLDLSHTSVGDAGLKHLKNLKKLEVLSLGGNWCEEYTEITDLGIKILAESLPQLTELNLICLGISSKMIPDLNNIKHLEALNICSYELKGENIKRLQKHPSLHRLTLCEIKDLSVEDLQEFQNLRELYLYNIPNFSSGAGKETSDLVRLRKVLPKCKIEQDIVN